VFRAYLVAKGPVKAYIISALLFAILHLNLPAFIPTFAIGLILAFLYHRSGSLVPSIVAHALNNGFALTALYFVPRM
jgi:membrane protease YdiL (CAAX protease family)